MQILLASKVSGPEFDVWVPALQQALPEHSIVTEVTAENCADIEVAIVYQPLKNTLSALPNLRFFHTLSAGINGILEDSSIPTEIPFARLADPAMADTMAETALMLTLMAHRNALGYIQQQHNSVWQALPQTPAADVTVSILGLGNMGIKTAKLIAGIGYPTLGWSRRQKTLDTINCLSGNDGLLEILHQSDIVINLLPLTTETEGLFNKETFEKMKSTATFINLARGGHVVEEDLLSALNEGTLKHAMLDVFNVEPLPADHAFWHHAKVTILPHIAAITDPKTASAVVAQNITAFLRGDPVAHIVDRSREY